MPGRFILALGCLPSIDDKCFGAFAGAGKLLSKRLELVEIGSFENHSAVLVQFVLYRSVKTQVFSFQSMPV